jgi:hypothetical protein
MECFLLCAADVTEHNLLYCHQQSRTLLVASSGTMVRGTALSHTTPALAASQYTFHCITTRTSTLQGQIAKTASNKLACQTHCLMFAATAAAHCTAHSAGIRMLSRCRNGVTALPIILKTQLQTRVLFHTHCSRSTSAGVNVCAERVYLGVSIALLCFGECVAADTHSTSHPPHACNLAGRLWVMLQRISQVAQRTYGSSNNSGSSSSRGCARRVARRRSQAAACLPHSRHSISTVGAAAGQIFEHAGFLLTHLARPLRTPYAVRLLKLYCRLCTRLHACMYAASDRHLDTVSCCSAQLCSLAVLLGYSCRPSYL